MLHRERWGHFLLLSDNVRSEVATSVENEKANWCWYSCSMYQLCFGMFCCRFIPPCYVCCLFRHVALSVYSTMISSTFCLTQLSVQWDSSVNFNLKAKREVQDLPMLLVWNKVQASRKAFEPIFEWPSKGAVYTKEWWRHVDDQNCSKGLQSATSDNDMSHQSPMALTSLNDDNASEDIKNNSVIYL